ncbi:YeeE/YedE family protein OS=Streptomyces tendae OX=1932 GN=GUR47_23210 PE=3 SV=1 [Streptomyces tendae]
MLLLFGLGLGVALFHSRFGFTSAWRQLVAVGNGTGLRAHALLLGTTATLFALVIGTETGLFGSSPRRPPDPSASACSPGRRSSRSACSSAAPAPRAPSSRSAAGQASIVLTLGGFVAGATLAAWQFDLWKARPGSPSCCPSTSAGSVPGP